MGNSFGPKWGISLDLDKKQTELSGYTAVFVSMCNVNNQRETVHATLQEVIEKVTSPAKPK